MDGEDGLSRALRWCGRLGRERQTLCPGPPPPLTLMRPNKHRAPPTGRPLCVLGRPLCSLSLSLPPCPLSCPLFTNTAGIFVCLSAESIAERQKFRSKQAAISAERAKKFVKLPSHGMDAQFTQWRFMSVDEAMELVEMHPERYTGFIGHCRLGQRPRRLLVRAGRHARGPREWRAAELDGPRGRVTHQVYRHLNLTPIISPLHFHSAHQRGWWESAIAGQWW